MDAIRKPSEIGQSLTEVFRRFPLAILMIVLLTLAVLYLVNAEPKNFDEVRLFTGPVLAGYLAIIMTLMGEGRGKPIYWAFKLPIVIAALLACYFYEVLRFNPWLAIAASILFLGSAPFWRKGQDNVAVWDFTHRIWVGVLFAVAGSILFSLGLVFITEALQSLFNLDVEDLTYEVLLPIGLAGLAPIYWLSTLADPRTELDDSLRNPNFISRAIAFLGVWLLAPLVLVFAVILLAYLVQIVTTGGLPEGETAALVTPFLIVGTLTWLILDPPFIREKRLAKIYRGVWFWAAIPAAVLLAIAVILRVKGYGLTQDRYLLAVGVLWALAVSIWYLWQRGKERDLRFIPGLAALLFALASFGPWGSIMLPNMNQKARVNEALIAESLLGEDGFVIPAAATQTPSGLNKRKLSGLSYLYTHNEKSWVQNKFSKSDTMFAKAPDRGFSRYSIIKRIDERFKLSDEGEAIEKLFEISSQGADISNVSQYLGRTFLSYWTDNKVAIGTSGLWVEKSGDTLLFSVNEFEYSPLSLLSVKGDFERDAAQVIDFKKPIYIGDGPKGKLWIAIEKAQMRKRSGENDDFEITFAVFVE